MGIPDRIAGYEIEARLGQGGMGTVYLARDPELGRRVALKLIQAELDSTEARDRFAKEARSIAALNHPNIVTLYHSGQFESRPFLVLEYIEGRSVASIIKTRESVPLVARLRWLEGLCEGLQFAHDRGVIHRDIKPANLMIDHLDRLRILDFGIARIAGAARTEYSGLMGTPAYMAPEYVRGEEADHRADIFAAGAVAYELLTFEPAFPGKTHATIMHRVMECAPAPFVEVGTVDVDPQLEQIILGALEKKPSDRFQAAREFRDALRAVRARIELGGEVWTSTDAGTAVGTADAVEPGATWHVPGREHHPSVAYTLPAEPALGATDVVGALVAGVNQSSGSQHTGAEVVGQNSAPQVSSPPVHDSSWRRNGVIASGVIAAAAAALAVFTYLVSPEPSPASAPLSETTAAPIPKPDEPSGTGANVDANPVDSRDGNAGKAVALPEPGLPKSDTQPDIARGSIPPSAGSAPVGGTAGVALSAKNLFDGAGAPGRAADGATNPGLLYRILRRTENDSPLGVDPETTTFRTGQDRVRFAFQPNVDGYLYVAQEGTDGRWDVLFPDPDINGGRNDVRSFTTYVIPSDSWFRINPPAGTDKIFVFLSKTKVVELPELNRPVTTHESLALADVNKLTDTISKRVLMFERTSVPQSSSTGPGEAIYVVHRDSFAGAVTVTFNLTHK
jgi:serine/threonine protein kinase